VTTRPAPRYKVAVLWFYAAPLARAIDAALAGLPDGRVAIVGDLRLARRLAQRHRAVLVASGADLRRAGALAVEGRADALPFEAGELAAIVGHAADGWPALAEWRRVVRPGGAIAMLDRGEPTEPARRALCAGLTAIGQRQVGRTLVTSGRVAA
jgi:hypothetical protein